MIVIDYQKKYHKKIIHACVLALKQGRVIAYPTDTSYGLAVDASNIKAVKKLYKVKGRGFNKPVSIISPSADYTKKVGQWSKLSSELAKKFWPGPLTIAVELKAESKKLKALSGGTGFLGIRVPKNIIALDLAHQLGRPITATSANLSGKKDCYSAAEIVEQYKNAKNKPDIIINFGKLAYKKPSTLVKIIGNSFEVIRRGPITKVQILKAL